MLILVRHGEATHHTEKLTGGWTDSVLTEKGREQLKALGERLAIDFKEYQGEIRILASDLQRAVESADIIAKAIAYKGKIEYCPFLREKNNGVAAGMKEEQAKKIFRKPATEHELNHRNYPGGETRNEFYNRSVDGLWQYVDVEKENLIIVAHKGTLQNIIFRWMGMNMAQVVTHNLSVDIQPASVTVLGVNKWHEHTVFLLNDTAHLHKAKSFGIFAFKYENR